MGDEANSERHRRERAVRLIEHGTDLTGPLAGAGVGMLGGPLGALAGAAVGAAVQKVLIRVGDEFAQRQASAEGSSHRAGSDDRYPHLSSSNGTRFGVNSVPCARSIRASAA